MSKLISSLPELQNKTISKFISMHLFTNTTRSSCHCTEFVSIR